MHADKKLFAEELNYAEKIAVFMFENVYTNPVAKGQEAKAEALVQRAEESGADLVIAHYNRITPPRPRAEDDPRPEICTLRKVFAEVYAERETLMKAL